MDDELKRWKHAVKGIAELEAAGSEHADKNDYDIVNVCITYRELRAIRKLYEETDDATSREPPEDE